MSPAPDENISVTRLEPLPARFFARDTVEVARALLGHYLVHQRAGELRVGRIVETEAYLGPEDLACHSSKGRTARTEVMFGAPGLAYVFLVYGMHHCVNVVTGGGEAVLIRALEPVAGLGALRTDGPGRLTKALGITLRHNARPLSAPPLFVARAETQPARRISRGPRVGVEYAGRWANKPLRFWLVGSDFVSAR